MAKSAKKTATKKVAKKKVAKKKVAPKKKTVKKSTVSKAVNKPAKTLPPVEKTNAVSESKPAARTNGGQSLEPRNY